MFRTRLPLVAFGVGLTLALAAGRAASAPPSCIVVEPRDRTSYYIVNNCHGHGYALVRTTNERRRPECEVVRISTNRVMAPLVASYFGQRPEIVDACGDTPSCRRELRDRSGSC